MAGVIVWGVAVGLLAASTDARGEIQFQRDIRRVLSDNCFHCHGPDGQHRKADLRLDLAEGIFGDRGGYAAVVPGKPEQSELLKRIRAEDADERMPPEEEGKELTEEEIRKIEQWIKEGALFEEHWAYLPPERVEVPKVKKTEWPLNPIDSFVLARLEAEGLEPSPEADAVMLARRLHFDLTGLPPDPLEAVRLGSGGERDRAYEDLVDRLLSSPHYGERMAIHWLDLVRYADTVGYHGDQEHPISPYRDYVIKAFNENLPFDQFTIEQLAGDLLDEPSTWQRIATGYNRVLQTTHEGGAQAKEYLAKYAADRVRNASGVWLAATMGCAECHDHKYDPYTQKDFYSFAAFFADVQEQGAYNAPDTSPTTRPPELQVWDLNQYGRMQWLEHWIEVREKEMQSGWALPEVAEELARLQAEREALQKQFRKTMVTEPVEPRPMRVLPRGDWMDESGPLVDPAVPHFMTGMEKEGRANRLDLARWLVSEENPVTARVFVNRLWRIFFGEGLSASLDDFGAQGEAPVHPELLDWLAVEFMESGWDVKQIVRLMVTSRTYRQSSVPRPELQVRDPENRLVARQSRFRLPAEMIRDNALAVSGLLVDEIGGPSARPYQPAGYYQHLNFPKRSYEADEGKNQYRRGVYTHWQRVFLHPMLKAFDAPTREECTAERPVSNTPLGALVLMNDPSFVEAARVFAERILKEGGAEAGQRMKWAWKEALTREPAKEELAVLRGVLEAELAHYQGAPEEAEELLSVGNAKAVVGETAAELAAWTAVARALFNLNEFIYRN